MILIKRQYHLFMKRIYYILNLYLIFCVINVLKCDILSAVLIYSYSSET